MASQKNYFLCGFAKGLFSDWLICMALIVMPVRNYFFLWLLKELVWSRFPKETTFKKHYIIYNIAPHKNGTVYRIPTELLCLWLSIRVTLFVASHRSFFIYGLQNKLIIDFPKKMFCCFSK